MTDPASASPAKSVVAARCPRCGQGRLYPGLFRLGVEPRCAHCGLDFGFAEIGDGPAVFAIFILGALVLAAAMIAEFKLGIPYLVHMPVWLLLTPLAAVWLLRSLKAALLLIQYRQRRGGSEGERP